MPNGKDIVDVEVGFPGSMADQNINGELAPGLLTWGLAVGDFNRLQVSFWF